MTIFIPSLPIAMPSGPITTLTTSHSQELPMITASNATLSSHSIRVKVATDWFQSNPVEAKKLSSLIEAACGQGVNSAAVEVPAEKEAKAIESLRAYGYLVTSTSPMGPGRLSILWPVD